MKRVAGRGRHWAWTSGVVVVLLLAGCSGNGVKAQGGGAGVSPSVAAGVSPSPAPTIDPRAKPALQAYESLLALSNRAAQHPTKINHPFPADSDFTKFSFDPLRSQYRAYIWGLAAAGDEVRGAPSVPHLTVKSVDLAASPWPTVTLTDCEVGTASHTYNIKSGKRLSDGRPPRVPLPYLDTVTMILYQKHWGAEKIVFDSSRTCTA